MRTITGTLQEDFCGFMMICQSVLTVRNVRDEHLEKIKTTVYVN